MASAVCTSSARFSPITASPISPTSAPARAGVGMAYTLLPTAKAASSSAIPLERRFLRSILIAELVNFHGSCFTVLGLAATPFVTRGWPVVPSHPRERHGDRLH